MEFRESWLTKQQLLLTSDKISDDMSSDRYRNLFSKIKDLLQMIGKNDKKQNFCKYKIVFLFPAIFGKIILKLFIKLCKTFFSVILSSSFLKSKITISKALYLLEKLIRKTFK